jgi:hypothetical protein
VDTTKNNSVIFDGSHRNPKAPGIKSHHQITPETSCKKIAMHGRGNVDPDVFQMQFLVTLIDYNDILVYLTKTYE